MEITDRELRILNLLAEGMTKEVIKTSLKISHVTLEKDLAVLKAKFNAFNLPNLIYLATKQNVI
jgi:DNA-binding CsgD family transcriptional regulator